MRIMVWLWVAVDMEVEGLRLKEFRLEGSWILGIVRDKSIDGAEAAAASRSTSLDDVSRIMVVLEDKYTMGSSCCGFGFSSRGSRGLRGSRQ